MLLRGSDACRVHVDPDVDVSQLRTMMRNMCQGGCGCGMFTFSGDQTLVVRVDRSRPVNLMDDGSDDVLALVPTMTVANNRSMVTCGLK